MVKAILFDMDGVLIDSHDAWFYIFNKALDHFEGKKITVEEFDNKLWAKAFDKVAKDYFTAPLEEIREYYKEIYADYKDRVTVMDNAKKTLSTLKKKGLLLAVVSNTQQNVVEKVREVLAYGNELSPRHVLWVSSVIWTLKKRGILTKEWQKLVGV